ncbi:hypothetical protein [Caballeronia sp. LZ035]|uniref:hypothetical protein n=1 Tax=Caballeronia sp. LZ035 TaxID=3038568 RepID=UPI0028617EFE|nr:hypothetical protein [Caballeronia sp. LZ035]MDR5758661.1 hypothetical protein [Caballeronia sp. LZ035]
MAELVIKRKRFAFGEGPELRRNTDVLRTAYKAFACFGERRVNLTKTGATLRVALLNSNDSHL